MSKKHTRKGTNEKLYSKDYDDEDNAADIEDADAAGDEDDDDGLENGTTSQKEIRKKENIARRIRNSGYKEDEENGQANQF
jgi:hypothetical protein